MRHGNTEKSLFPVISPSIVCARAKGACKFAKGGCETTLEANLRLTLRRETNGHVEVSIIELPTPSPPKPSPSTPCLPAGFIYSGFRFPVKGFEVRVQGSDEAR